MMCPACRARLHELCDNNWGDQPVVCTCGCTPPPSVEVVVDEASPDGAN